MTLNQFKRMCRKNNRYVVWEGRGSMSPNWDGTTWQIQWSDDEMERIKTTAYKKFDGLAYCRSCAIRQAYRNEAERLNVEIDD